MSITTTELMEGVKLHKIDTKNIKQIYWQYILLQNLIESMLQRMH